MATVAEVMNTDVLTVDPTASIGEAAEKMMDAGVGAVVVMEDLHWADEGSIDVLLYVARRIERAPAAPRREGCRAR